MPRKFQCKGIIARLDAMFPGRKKRSLDARSETSSHKDVAGDHPEGQNGTPADLMAIRRGGGIW
jgi:hypothetical protein